jgi:hypothetical protein
MIRVKWLLAALALPLSIGVSFAAIDPNKLPQVPCSSLQFGAAFLAKYPKAPEACQDARVYKGERYAKFEAKVYISSPQFMTVEMLDSSGATVTTFSFKPAPGQGVHVNGRVRKFSDMAVGEKLTIWVSEKRLEARDLPSSTTHSWSLLPPLNK